MRFTDRSIDALKTKTERYELWEDGRTGLGLRITPRGIKSFVFMYRFDRKARRMTLGRYSKAPATGISLATARRMQGEAKEKLDAGVDPGTEVVEAQQVARAAETVRELVDLYLEVWAKPRKRSAAADERMLFKDVVPLWGHLKAGDIRKRDVVSMLDKIVNRGAPIGANQTLAVIRKVFNFGLSRDIAGLAINPCSGIGNPSPANVRERRLSDAEIITFWNGSDNDKVDLSKALYLCLRLQLATAARKGEVVGATWTEFDLDEARWTIPATRSKNGVEHIVPLSGLAMSILQEMKTLADDEAESEWLLPSRVGDRPFSPNSVSRSLRRNLPHIGLQDFTPHDLRRTAASLMGRLQVPRFIISRVLNHVDSTVTGLYDCWEYLPEKQDALNRLGAHIETFLAADTADNVAVMDGEEALRA